MLDSAAYRLCFADKVSAASVLIPLVRIFLWAATALLILYPLAMVFIGALFPGLLNDRPIQLADLFSNHVRVAWLNTLQLGLTVSLMSLGLGVPLALLSAQSDRSKWLDLIMSLPFLTPPFLSTLAWTLAVGRHGYLSRLGFPGEALQSYLFSFGGLSLLMALHYTPIVYFVAHAQMARVPASLLWAAQVSGASRFRVIASVLVPLALPALLGGGFLAFAAAIEEYGTPLVIGNRIGFPVVATEIGRLVSVFPIQLTLASALGATLMILVGVVYGLSLWLQRRDVAYSSRCVYPPPELIPGSAAMLLWIFAGIYTLIAVVIPYSSIFLTSLLRLVSVGPALSNLTAQIYSDLLASDSSGLREALVVSLTLALMAAILGALLGVGAVRDGAGLAALAMVPVATPAITMAVGFIRAWNAPWTGMLPLYGTVSLVGLFYTAQYLPYAVQYARAGCSAIHPSYEWAARVHGARRLRTFGWIILPLLRPYCTAAAIMIFSISFRELVGSVLLRPPGVHTSSTFILAQFEQGSPAVGMAMGVIAITVAVVSTSAARKLGDEPHRARS